MNLVNPKTTEDRIIRALTGRPQKAGELLAGINVTKQGLYAALRKLKSEEVVVTYHGNIALNTSWVQQMSDLIRQAKQTYLPDSDSSSILSLKDRESVSYTFTDTKHLDAFWGHTQNMLVEQTPASEPVYSYDPHYWFYIARKETERNLVDSIVRKGKQFLMTVGGATALDKAIKIDFSTDEKQYHMEDLFKKGNYYVVIIGNYVTEVTLDLAIAARVEGIYNSSSKLDEQTTSQLKELLTAKARHKIKISRNSRKANILKSKLSKNFFVKTS